MLFRSTLEALRELVQAAGLTHPSQIRASHIVRREGNHSVRLLANQLLFIRPGELLVAADGQANWPHAVFELYWPQASAATFAPVN